MSGSASQSLKSIARKYFSSVAIQNDGSEKQTKARKVTPWSSALYWRSAEITPMVTPTDDREHGGADDQLERGGERALQHGFTLGP